MAWLDTLLLFSCSKNSEKLKNTLDADMNISICIFEPPLYKNM